MSNSRPFELRRATLDDASRLVELRLEFLEEVNGKSAPQDLRESLASYFEKTLATGDFVAWLAVAQGEVVGTSGLVFMHRPPSHSNLNGHDAYIMNIYTVPTWRGQGVGTALFSRLLEHVETTECGLVFLSATPEGRPLYEKFGFRASETEVEMSLKIPRTASRS